MPEVRQQVRQHSESPAQYWKHRAEEAERAQVKAFIDGAKWWHLRQMGEQMMPGDVAQADTIARRRYQRATS